MTTVLHTSKAAVRRLLLHTQSLLGPWPTPSGQTEPDEIMNLIRSLGCVQIDPVAAVTGNQHLVLGARDAGYTPGILHGLLKEHQVFEYFANAACVIPMEDYSTYEPIRARYRERLAPSLESVRQAADHVLQRLRDEGPLPSKAFQATRRVSGYWDSPDMLKTKDTSLAINLLRDSAAIRVVARQGTERYFAITEAHLEQQGLQFGETWDAEKQKQALMDKYAHAYRVIDGRDPRLGWFPRTAAERRSELAVRVRDGRLIPLQVEEVAAPYYIRAEDEPLLREMQREEAHYEPVGPVRFLPPLDNLLWRRERIVDLFDFHYKWEIYTPESKRTYGYYAMPILHGDRLIGRMDPRLDRKTGELAIQLLHIEAGAPAADEWLDDFKEGLALFAGMHGARSITVRKTDPKGLGKLFRKLKTL